MALVSGPPAPLSGQEMRRLTAPHRTTSAARRKRQQPGPVQLLHESIRRAGGAITGPATAAFPNEVAYDLMRAPKNWIKSWLGWMGHKAALATASKRRKTMQGAKDYDPVLNQKLKEGLTAQQTRDWLMIQSGGLWTSNALYKAGYLEHGMCPWCGQEREGGGER